MTRDMENRHGSQSHGAVVLPASTSGAGTDQQLGRLRGGVLLPAAQESSRGFTFDDWSSKEGHEAVARAIAGLDERVKGVKKLEPKGQPAIDAIVSLDNEKVVMAEATRAFHDLFKFTKEPYFQESQQLEALWILELRVNCTVVSGSVPIPAISDRDQMLEAIRAAQGQAEAYATTLESTYGGGNKMVSVARLAKYREDLRSGWEGEAQVYSNKIRDDCFPANSGFRLERLYHPVKVSLKVASLPELYSDHTQGLPGLLRSKLLVSRGGLLSEMDDVVAFTQKAVDAKLSKRQISSFDGEKWLIVVCLDAFIIWQVDDSFNNSDIPHRDLLVPFQALNHGAYDEVWLVAPANNCPNQATVIKTRHGSESTVETCTLQ